ncbi:MAG TPA: ATP-binding cassette domain-containing protein [Longimicrobiales bacterium]|nr:ATP-binding cassette domain-containing protein [Longimicrobiales bacterium]
MHPIVELRNVRAYRGETCVFRDLTLELHRGESTVILGPNGAGKSTLLQLLTRQIYPVRREGSVVRLFGQDRWNVTSLRSRLGIVSFDLHTEYAARLTALQVVLSGFDGSVGIPLHRRARSGEVDRATGVMERLGVAHLRDRPFPTLSTGEQRRFLLARALVHQPEALILDEPTSGLDLKATFEFLETLRGLIREGTTVFLVTHHIHEIPPEIRRAVLIKAGRVCADGAKDEVLTGPSLSELFDTPLEVVRVRGYYQVVPRGEED